MKFSSVLLGLLVTALHVVVSSSPVDVVDDNSKQVSQGQDRNPPAANYASIDSNDKSSKRHASPAEDHLITGAPNQFPGVHDPLNREIATVDDDDPASASKSKRQFGTPVELFFYYGSIAMIILVGILKWRRDLNCHKFDLIYIQCILRGNPAPDTRLLERIDWNMTSATKGRYLNNCLGGDGADYVYHNVIDGSLGCRRGEVRWETKVRVWRWRANYKYCMPIDTHARGYARAPVRYWQHVPMGSFVKCKPWGKY